MAHEAIGAAVVQRCITPNVAKLPELVRRT